MFNSRLNFFAILILTGFLTNLCLSQGDSGKTIKRDTIRTETQKKTTQVESLITKTTTTEDRTWLWLVIIGVVLLIIVFGYLLGRSRDTGSSSSSGTTNRT